MSSGKDEPTNREIALLIVPGLILTIGSIWWMRGWDSAALILGLLLLVAGWACARTE